MNLIRKALLPFAVCIPILLITVEARDATNREIQDWFMKIPARDDLPLLDRIFNCVCPRIYLPVCGSNSQSYTNACKMNCLNMKLKLTGRHRVRVQYQGMCPSYFDPFNLRK
ncbi:hypothetical protein B5X24_HaOG207151 [Helicoverpa armigera]|uniref:Kazal-like domain-containing protein n=1 Tax=Helicoverpa armigera TaxID=29058 RepID=A0A2W1BIY1_HELAM|nr:hypothetical protein B5X24_HaOG207151 [Helicoverpa armigera]